MAGENDRSRKIYYSMGEVAEMLDVSTSLVRFWEKQFDILNPHKNKKGNRMFSPEDVRNLKTIYHLVKERGMTLAGAAKYLKANKRGSGAVERDMEIAERLASIRALLLEVRNELGGGSDNYELRITNYEVEEFVDDETEKMLDFEPEPVFEPEPEIEPETVAEVEPQKPLYIEQTLF